MMKKLENRNLVFIDAETDGLRGTFLTVAMIATDHKGRELDHAYYGISKENMVVTHPWAKEHVIPIMGTYYEVESEEQLLRRVWKFWSHYAGPTGASAYLVSYIPYPVEFRLFEKCISLGIGPELQAPFPFLDLGSMLAVTGKDPLGLDAMVKNENKHNALSDVEAEVKAYRLLFCDKEE